MILPKIGVESTNAIRSAPQANHRRARALPYLARPKGLLVGARRAGPIREMPVHRLTTCLGVSILALWCKYAINAEARPRAAGRSRRASPRSYSRRCVIRTGSRSCHRWPKQGKRSPLVRSPCAARRICRSCPAIWPYYERPVSWKRKSAAAVCFMGYATKRWRRRCARWRMRSRSAAPTTNRRKRS